MNECFLDLLHCEQVPNYLKLYCLKKERRKLMLHKSSLKWSEISIFGNSNHNKFFNELWVVRNPLILISKVQILVKMDCGIIWLTVFFNPSFLFTLINNFKVHITVFQCQTRSWHLSVLKTKTHNLQTYQHRFFTSLEQYLQRFWC